MTSGSAPFPSLGRTTASSPPATQDLLTHDPTLLSPGFTKPCTLHTDASDEAVGAALLQEKEAVLHPLVCHSTKLDIPNAAIKQ